MPVTQTKEKAKPFVDVLCGKSRRVPPVWFMRQAGRYLPEYQEIRRRTSSFLEMCYTPDIAAEVTLQPIRRFHMDAAIIFSDILVVPHALGVPLDYVEGKGPVLSSVATHEAVEALEVQNIADFLQPVFTAISKVSAQLPPDTALIGFAGSPWTVATYMVEGGTSKNHARTKQFAYSEPAAFELLIEKLIKATVNYLCLQIEAGAEVLQIFDSWAGVLPEDEFRKWVIEPNRRIVDAVRALYPSTPIIGFPKGAGMYLEGFAKETKVDAVGVDYTQSLEWVKDTIQPLCAVQGNLDPSILAFAPKPLIKQRVERICDTLGQGAFIFNLGHGILPETPVENVEFVLDIVRNR